MSDSESETYDLRQKHREQANRDTGGSGNHRNNSFRSPSISRSPTPTSPGNKNNSKDKLAYPEIQNNESPEHKKLLRRKSTN